MPKKFTSITITCALVSILTVVLGGCGQSSTSSSSSSSTPPSGFTSDQRDQYKQLRLQGQEYVKQQMDAYDRANKR